MKTSISKLLLPYQIDHVINLSEKLKKYHICFDSSCTGFGKTYSAIATAKHMKMKAIIICPKTIISFWKRVADLFGVELLGISNYELLIRTTHYRDGKKETAPYITKTADNSSYVWNVPENTMIIFDEVHRACNPHAYIGQLLLTLTDVYNDKKPLLLISATICNGPAKFKLFSVLLKWCSSVNSVYNWLETTYNPVSASKMIKEKLGTKNIIKVNIADLGDSFQKNQVSADYYDIKQTDAKTIDSLHNEIIDSLKILKNKESTDKRCGFTIGIRQRQKIELLKVQIFVDLVEQFIDNMFSVVIFVNYTETIKVLAKSLKTNCIVYGEQGIKEREQNIDNFMKDKERVIICNIKCGGSSISLNDINGVYPRVSLISPCLSSIDLIQAIGRICRANSKSASFNKIIYANTPVEKMLCNRLKNKCSMYSTINDTDLDYVHEK